MRAALLILVGLVFGPILLGSVFFKPPRLLFLLSPLGIILEARDPASRLSP